MKAAARRGRKVSRRQIMEEALAMWLDEWDDEPAEDAPACAASTQATTVPAPVSASAASTQRSEEIDGLPFDWWLSLRAPALVDAAMG